MIRRTQLLLFLVAATGALWVGYGTVRAAIFHDIHEQQFANVVTRAAVPLTGSAVSDKDDGLGPDGVVGVLEIPRLDFSEVVASGDDDKTLKVAIGHLRDTPLPWANGNSVFAAHRDSHFRPLRNIRHGDLVRLKTRKGVLEYAVKDTMIVAPKDVWVLAPTKTRRLTLVTCYPFNYIGAAPQRFIVQAEAK